MPSPTILAHPAAPTGKRGGERAAVLLAAAVGAIGGMVAAAHGHEPAARMVIAGALFGAVFAGALGGRAASPGAGLIWGLGAGFVLWSMLPSAGVILHLSGHTPDAMLASTRTHFHELVGTLLCIGAPVGFFLGTWTVARSSGRPAFHWGRALAVGGGSGVVAALVFSRWMYQGDFYPLIAGYGTLSSHLGTVALHFAVACVIGGTFGLLFQSDVRNLGSAMGWGMAYSIFWWFLGQLTLFPLARGVPLDWSTGRASELFGSLVGHILHGLILGVVYAAVDVVWKRLFVDADPLNRKREGPGVHVLRSLSWGAAAGFIGGLAALPLLMETGVVALQAGLDAGVSTTVGVCLHLGISTLIGASYGVLFRGETSNTAFGSLWGLLFGLIWWYAGPLTLLPLIRTGECDWRPESAASLLPSLVGHLLFGIVTANVFMAFERYHTRWLMADPRFAASERARARPKDTPAPALCVFVLGLGILLPILLS